MDAARSTRLLSLTLLLWAPMRAHGSTTDLPSARVSVAAVIVSSSVRGEDADLLQSLRSDIARHPNEFITFATRAAATQFLRERGAALETDRTMVLRGIVGYWQGRTVAVVPGLAISSGVGLSR